MALAYRSRHIDFCFVHLRPSHREKLAAAGVLEIMGENHLFQKCDHAVAYLLERQQRDQGCYQMPPTDEIRVIERYLDVEDELRVSTNSLDEYNNNGNSNNNVNSTTARVGTAVRSRPPSLQVPPATSVTIQEGDDDDAGEEEEEDDDNLEGEEPVVRAR